MAGSRYPQTVQMCGDSPKVNSTRHRLQNGKKKKKLCSIVGHHWVCVVAMWLAYQPVSPIFVSELVLEDMPRQTVCYLPSPHTSLSLTGVFLEPRGPRRPWLWLSVGETLLPSSAVCYRQGHTVWLQTHLTSSTSPDFCPLNVPCITSHCSSIAVGLWRVSFWILLVSQHKKNHFN